MFWKTGSHACFLMLSASLTIACPIAFGEDLTPPRRADQVTGSRRVISVFPDLAHGTITITTNSKNPLPAPLIQYLPGPDGKTLMVADFEGINYQLATHLLKSENLAPDAWRQSGIQEIRIGQFSSQPPTMRISMGAFNARAFRSVAFHARPGALILKWTPGNPGQAVPTAPAQPPSDNHAVSTRSSAYRVAQAPAEVAPDAPDYRKAVQQTPTPATAYSAKTIKEVFSVSKPKPVAVAEARTEKLPESRAGRLVDTSQWMAPQDFSNSTAARRARKSGHEEDERRSGGILFKSTEGGNSTEAQRPGAGNTESKVSQERALQKPPSAVARWLKLDVLQSRSGSSRIKEAQASRSAETEPPVAPSSANHGSQIEPEGDGSEVQVCINDVEQLKDNGSTDVLVKTDRKISYKVFRLHEPERYVVDFDGLPALSSTQLPSVTDELLINGMRTGTPDDTGLTQRLVLDLKDNTVDVADELVDGGMTLSLKVRPSSSAPMPAQLKAHLVKDKLIVLDAGHGGSDPGAQRSGVSEKDLTLQITGELKKRLTQMGARVVMTRSDDTFISLEERVRITNDTQPDLFVSIHINALESTSSIYGIETYYQTDQSRALATAIHQQLVQGLSVPDRSVRKARFYVINHTPIPAILAEVGFISNEKERNNLGAADYQVKIADSVSAGIVQYLTEKQELAGKSGKQSF